MKKKIIIAIVAVVMMVACIGCFTACNKEEKVLTIGITDYEPMDYQNDKGEWIGFDADLANEFGKEYGYTIKFQIIDWDSKTTELNSGSIDLIWNGMTADDDLAQSMDFSVAYATNMQCIVVKNENAAQYSSVDYLKSVKIAVETGSAANKVCNSELSISDDDLTCSGSQVNALLEVVAGTSDAAMVDYTLAYNVVGKNDYAGLTIVDTNTLSFGKEVFAIGARKDSELLPKLNEFFGKKYADGSLNTLAEKYNVALNDEALSALNK